jgi:hypothetical protein
MSTVASRQRKLNMPARPPKYSRGGSSWPNNISGPGEPFLSAKNANRRAKFARMQNGNTALGTRLASDVEKEVELVRKNKQTKLKLERNAAAQKKALDESIQSANQLQKANNNNAMKKLEQYEKMQNAALKSRYNAENEAEYARQNELNRARREEWKKKAQNASRNGALRNASLRANRAGNQALGSLWLQKSNGANASPRRNARPAATMKLARRNALLPVGEGQLNLYKRQIFEQNKRIELMRSLFFQLRDQFKIFRLTILEQYVDGPSTAPFNAILEQFVGGHSAPPPLQQPTYMLNDKLRRKWMRRKKNVFMQKRANAENARMAKFTILRSEAARANFNVLSKQLVVARQSRALPRGVVSIITSMERIQQGMQRARTPQQQRSAMHKIAPFIRVTSHLAPIFGLALGLAARVFIVKTRAATIASIFALHSHLDVMRMLMMLMMAIAPLLVYMIVKKSGGLR